MARKKQSKFKNKTTANARKQTEGTSKYGYLALPKGVKLFQETPGSSNVLLDFLPYIVTDKKHSDRDDELEIALVGEQWYKRPFKIHRDVGQDNEKVICPATYRRKCPICEYRLKLMEEGKSWDDPEVKVLKASNRNLYAIVPKNHKEYEEVPHVWDISQFCFQDKLNEELDEDEDRGVFPDLEEGLTLKLRFSKENLGKTEKTEFAKISRIDFKERDEPYDESILKKVPSLDEMIPALSYDALHAKFFELEDEEISQERVVPPDEDQEDPNADDEPEEKTTEKESKKEKPKEEECIACEGEGVNTKGNPCRICDGTGVKPDKKKDEKTPKTDSKPKEKKEKESSEKECPHGHEFAVDYEKHDECDDCKIWEDCIDAKDELEK